MSSEELTAEDLKKMPLSQLYELALSYTLMEVERLQQTEEGRAHLAANAEEFAANITKYRQKVAEELRQKMAAPERNASA